MANLTSEDIKVWSDLADQSLMIVKWEPFKSAFLAVFALLILIIGVLSRIAIINFIRKMAPYRPISFNILLDQMIELPTFIIFHSMMLVTLVTAKPMESIFGSIGSRLFWIASMFHNDSMIIGGIGIAFFRLICIQDLGFSLNVKKVEKLMNQIIVLEMALQIVMNGFGIVGGLLSNEATLMNTAKGRTALMENILNPPTDEFHRRIGMLCIGFCFFAATTFMIIELACYIVIYVQVYKNDERIKDAISKQTVSYRRKRNIISLSTQLIGIIVELICSTTGALIVAFQVTDASFFPILAALASALTSAFHVLGSAEMRSYYGID